MPGADVAVAPTPAERGSQRFPGNHSEIGRVPGRHQRPGRHFGFAHDPPGFPGPFALVGDASGSVDSLTGEGLGLAFRQANALAEALANDDLNRYEAAHRSINRPSEVMSQVLLAMEDRTWLRRRALDALAKEAHLFDRLLAAHVGTLSSRTFGFGNIFRLGWRLLANPS